MKDTVKENTVVLDLIGQEDDEEKRRTFRYRKKKKKGRL